MHRLYELKDKLMNELEEYSQNGKYSKEDVETIKYIASAIDHICNICERDDDDYSQRGSDGMSMENRRYSRNGSYRDGYARNYSGNYAGRRNARRDSMGRYSGTGDPGEMIAEIENLMQDAPNEQIKQKMRQLVQELEQM